MKRSSLYFSYVILLVMGGYASPPFCPAHDLFTGSYLIQPEDPGWMQLLWQTDTHLQGGCHIGSSLEKGHGQYRWLEKDLAGADKPCLYHTATGGSQRLLGPGQG